MTFPLRFSAGTNFRYRSCELVTFVLCFQGSAFCWLIFPFLGFHKGFRVRIQVHFFALCNLQGSFIFDRLKFTRLGCFTEFCSCLRLLVSYFLQVLPHCSFPDFCFSPWVCRADQLRLSYLSFLIEGFIAEVARNLIGESCIFLWTICILGSNLQALTLFFGLI